MSDVLKNPVVTGVGGVIGGLLVGSLLSLATIDSKIGSSIEDAMADMAETLEGDDDALVEVTERLAALEKAVSGAASEVAGLGETLSDRSGEVASVGEQIRSDLDERISALEMRIDDVAADLGNRMSETASEQTEALRAALETRPAPASAPDPEPEQPAEPVSEAPEALPPELRVTGETRGTGETFVLAGGSVRAFVQQANAQDGRARLSVNRVSSDLAVGEIVVVPHADGACRLGVAAVTEDGVSIGSDCDMPADDATLGDAYAPGTLALLADGQLRVFVSGIFGDEVRLALNGLETRRMRVGEAHEVEDTNCSVSVTGVRGNSVLLAGTCS
jgi:hypothetical protein